MRTQGATTNAERLQDHRRIGSRLGGTESVATAPRGLWCRRPSPAAWTANWTLAQARPTHSFHEDSQDGHVAEGEEGSVPEDEEAGLPESPRATRPTGEIHGCPPEPDRPAASSGEELEGEWGRR